MKREKIKERVAREIEREVKKIDPELAKKFSDSDLAREVHTKVFGTRSVPMLDLFVLTGHFAVLAVETFHAHRKSKEKNRAKEISRKMERLLEEAGLDEESAEEITQKSIESAEEKTENL